MPAARFDVCHICGPIRTLEALDHDNPLLSDPTVEFNCKKNDLDTPRLTPCEIITNRLEELMTFLKQIA
jgi:hypothetical protein